MLRTKISAGELSVGETVHQRVDTVRRDRVRANHSATHLLHAALRRHLGSHVTQKGSLVAPDYFRFDFSHPKALTREEIEVVEAEVNAQIRSNEPVTTRLMRSACNCLRSTALSREGSRFSLKGRLMVCGADETFVRLCRCRSPRAAPFLPTRLALIIKDWTRIMTCK